MQPKEIPPMRWVIRQGRKVLQYRYVSWENIPECWVDVPINDETDDARISCQLKGKTGDDA